MKPEFCMKNSGNDRRIRMQYTVVLNDAHKQFTLDQDKIFPPDETVKRIKEILEKLQLNFITKI